MQEVRLILSTARGRYVIEISMALSMCVSAVCVMNAIGQYQAISSTNRYTKVGLFTQVPTIILYFTHEVKLQGTCSLQMSTSISTTTRLNTARRSYPLRQAGFVFEPWTDDKRGQQACHGRVHDCQKVQCWKACTKPMEVVPPKFKYKQKKDNMGSTIAGVYAHSVCWCERHWKFLMGFAYLLVLV